MTASLRNCYHIVWTKCWSRIAFQKQF